jgi:RNA polymerase sigma factor for flagellar operon FliA
MPDSIRHDDLESAALVGLTEAAERFDAARGEPFVAFAAKRIRGAVLDELRRGDLMPRRARSAANKLGEAVSSLERRLGRSPEDGEVARELGVSLAAFRDCFAGLVPVRLVELPDAGGPSEIADGGGSPFADLERAEAIRLVRAALDAVPERDALVLSLYYVEEFSYIEIGEVLGVSESRVCQLHARAIKRVRQAFEKLQGRN